MTQIGVTKVITLNYPRTPRYTGEISYIAGLLEATGYTKEVSDLKDIVEYLDSDAETLEECFHEQIAFIEKLIEEVELLMPVGKDREDKWAKVRKLIKGWRMETRLVEEEEG